MSLGLCIVATLPVTLHLVVRVTPESIKLQGGALSIDFANSVDWTEDEQEVVATDALLEADSLDRWGARLGVAGRPGGPEELELARGLRTALHHIFSALARDQQPDELSLARLRFAYAQAVAAGTLVPRPDGTFGLDWRQDEPHRVRFAVAADAVALLADPARVARLHRCPGRDCGWIFLDTSGRRRWCSMQTCGSREKMRRMYERKRAERAIPGSAAGAGGTTA
jgi:predicted RNA-binding Zn ribbon-like protein